MLRFLIGLIIGVIFSAEITNFLNSTELPTELKEQWIRYQLSKEDQNTDNTLQE